MSDTALVPSIFRVDKFVVPAAAREEFLSKVRPTHELFDTLEGCRQNLVLEQVAGPGEFNIVTIVEWDNAAAVEKAKSAVQALHARLGIRPREVFARLGVKADMASYGTVAAA